MPQAHSRFLSPKPPRDSEPVTERSPYREDSQVGRSGIVKRSEGGIPECLPRSRRSSGTGSCGGRPCESSTPRSEEHTSELQSRQYLVCRLLLEKKKPPHVA